MGLLLRKKSKLDLLGTNNQSKWADESTKVIKVARIEELESEGKHQTQ